MTLYLTPGPFGGDGSREHPLRISSATMFDSVIEQVQLGGWDTIDLAEGVFLTQGVWRFRGFTTFPKPIRIRGAGMHQTIIRLSPDAITHTDLKDRPDLCVLWFGIPWTNNAGPYTVEDLTVDGNCDAFPANRLVTGGLIFHSNNVTCRRVGVIGIRGSTTMPNAPEAFGILINNRQTGPYDGPDGNNRVVDCVVESNGDFEEYVSPIFVSIQDHGRPIIQSEIVGCRTIGTGVKPTRIGVSLSPFTVISRYSAHNIFHSLYHDSKPLRNATARDCRFTGVVYSGPFIIVDAPKERVLVERCDFEFTPKEGEEWIGLTVWDKFLSGAEATDIEVRDCVFRGTGNRPFTPWSVKGKIKNIQFNRNITPAGSLNKPVIPGLTIESPRGYLIP